MSAVFRSVRDWFDGDERPACASHPWRDRAAVLVLVTLVGAAAGCSFLWLTFSQQVILGGLLLLVVAFAARQGWLKLFGPVLFYDLVRSARRLRFVVIRTLYALFIAFVLCWLFWILCLEQGWQQPAERMSNFATGFLYTFLSIQFITVVLLTPAYTAGAIAEEKERRTLEFILATDLRNREVILGKVASRLLNLSLLLLAGVPILAFLQFLGGVDIGVVLAGFVATGLTMYSLAGVSMLNSVLCRRARDAIVMTYLMAVAYLLLANGAWLIKVIIGVSGWGTEILDFPPPIAGWQCPFTVADLIDWFNAGNIAFAVFRLGRGASASAVFEQELPAVLGGYAAFHAVVGTFALAWSVLRLRVLALREDVRRAARKKGAVVRARSRPRVGRHPMIWKEVFAEGGLRLNSAGRVIAGVLVCAGFLPTIITLYVYFDTSFGHMTWQQVGRAMNGFQMRFVGTTVAVLMLLAVVVRAAGSVRSERERNTFDELLTTRLTNSEILFGKWLGAVLSVRWGWAWLGLIWGVSVVTGGVFIFVLPLILMAWVTYAAVGAGVGLWFSIGSKSSLRAVVASLATMIFLCGGHWLLTGLFCYFPMGALGIRERQFEWMLYLEAGQTPPFVMGLFAFCEQDFEHGWDREWLVCCTMASLFGVGCWAGLVPVLWLLVKRRFEQVTGRTPSLRPERMAPRPRRKPAPRKALVIDAEPPANGQPGDGQVLTALPVDEKELEGKGPLP